ncbi:MAG: Mg-chelatase subunit ChlD [Saprospiraceae bacterium]|jgi:Mg-chelatase subunit ChlD
MQEDINDITKWRLILGGDEADGTGVSLSQELSQIDGALGALYEFDQTGEFGYGKGQDGENGSSKLGGGGKGGGPSLSKWLGDIRKYFPASTVEVLQNDAMKFPELKKKLIFEPEILDNATPDVNLVATLMELGKLIPSKTKATARRVIQKVVDDLMQKLEQKTIAAISGAIDRSQRKQRPRHSEINWHTTILKNLKHYQPEYKTVIPEVLLGYGRKSKKSLKDVILCLDQSGSMGQSVVYSGIFGSVMASLPNVKTSMVVFDTEVADLTEDLKDPVDLLFGVQLGGGTDINKALTYCQEIVSKPDDTILVLITDLYEGGNAPEMHRRTKELVDSGVQVICLLALDDNGSPSYDKNHANQFSEIGIPVFACTPDMFPDLMAAAIKKADLKKWVGDRDVVLKG